MTKKITLKEQFTQMQIGDKLEYPAARLGSIKAVCSEYGFMMGRKFSTSKDRERRVVVVTRVS